jgi:D-alanyl-D-alanine dipeptidase
MRMPSILTGITAVILSVQLSAAIITKEQIEQASDTYLTRYKTASKRPAAKADDLVDLEKEIPGICIDLRYATTNNFTKSIVYPKAKCFLRRVAANKLKNVQTELKKKGLGLKVFDAYRPHRAQRIFWNLCPDPQYIADPSKGSKHNRGTAVDITIIDLKTKTEIEMPSAFDDFSDKAHRNYTAMNPRASKNCKLLEALMVKFDFIPFPSEWWHFDFKDWQSFDVLDVPFDKIG